MTPLADRTPSDIDAEINKLDQEVAYAEARMAHYQRLAEKSTTEYDREEMLAEFDYWTSASIEGYIKLSPLHDEYNRRPWTRYYLVTNSNGHVHHTTHCTTCYDGTSYAWLTQFSGTSHEDLVEIAGEKACTVCFPNAPVDVLKRASRLTTPEQEARKAEKAEKAQAAAVAQVVVNHYRDHGRTSVKVFKTDRAATNEIASLLSSMVGYGPTHPTFNEWRGNVEEIIDALVEKGSIKDGVAYYAEALEKARKKCIAEHKKFMKSATAAMYRAQGILDPEVDKPGYSPVKY